MGSNDTKSNSTPLTAEQRAETYSAGMNALNSDIPTKGYQPVQQKTLSGGDYDNLQNSLTQGYMTGLDYAKGKDIQNFNNSAGAKGIWSSGLALKGENDINQGYAGQYAQAGANATDRRYNLQSAENVEGNNLALQNAKNTQDSDWRKADYKAGVWNGTGGVVSSSSGGGWSI